MTPPVAHLITLNVIETLGQIQLASGFNGNLKVEEFKSQGRNNVGDLVAIVSYDADIEVPDEDTAAGYEYWIRPYWVQVYIIEPNSSDMSFDLRADILRADIGQALMQDFSRGGNALNTILLPSEKFTDPNDASGIIVNFHVAYRHVDGDPYTPDPVSD